MSDSEIVLDLQQQRLERAMGAELTNTQTIIKRSGVFDEVDKKYGIPEEERKKMEASGGGGASPEGGAPPPSGGPPPPPAGGGEPLSESNIFKNGTFDDLFDVEKAQQNIYEIENKLKDILKDS